MSDRVEGLLSELLGELRTHHAYIIARDSRLDTEDQQRETEKRERNERLEATMRDSVAIQKQAAASLPPPPNKELEHALYAPYFTIAKAELAEKLIGYIGHDVQNCGRAVMVLCLYEAHPEKLAEWNEQFPLIFQQAQTYLRDYPADQPGWNDYYMSRWLILQDPAAVAEILRRANLPGVVGELATWMMNSVASQIPLFAEALQRELLMSQVPGSI